MSSERWTPVPGHEGTYEVSSHGRVRSLDRTLTQKNCTRSMVGRILTIHQRTKRDGSPGHQTVVLSHKGICKREYVHRLVALAFHGDGEPGLEVCHRDDDCTNNTPENLYWGTHRSNMRDAVRNGRHHQKRKTHCKHGHEFTPSNTIPRSNNRRACRTCAAVIAARRVRAA